MRDLFTRLRQAADRYLGRCPRCMRTAFAVALAAWAVAAAIRLVIGDGAFAMAGAGVALALTALWVAHLLTFAARVVADPRGTGGVDTGVVLSRRQAGRLFVRALGGAAVATALPAAMFAVLAGTAQPARCDEFGCDGNLCDGAHPCNRGCKCVYPEPGKLGYCAPWYQQ